MKIVFTITFVLTLVFVLPAQGPAKGKTNTGLIFANESQYSRADFAVPPFFRGGVPNEVDLSNLMPPVGDQRPQNSCVGWALGYASRSYYNYREVQGNIPKITSPAFIYNLLNDGKNEGISIQRALKLMMDTGVCSLVNMPYQQYNWKKKPNSDQIREAANYQIETYRRIDLKYAEVNLKAELLRGNPVVCAARYDKRYFDYGHNTTSDFYVWDTIRSVDPKMGHAIVLVGYNNDKHAFKFINSWGTKWGNDGFGWIDYKIIGKAIREAYIIKPQEPVYIVAEQKEPKRKPGKLGFPGDYPDADADNVTDVFDDNYETKKLTNEISENEYVDFGFYFYVDTVEIEPIDSTSSDTNDERVISTIGIIRMPPHVCKEFEMVVQFFYFDSARNKVPIFSSQDDFKLANGQAATISDMITLHRSGAVGYTGFWRLDIPIAALDLPKSLLQEKDGATVYHLFAEPVLFADGFPLRVGTGVEFSLER